MNSNKHLFYYGMFANIKGFFGKFIVYVPAVDGEFPVGFN